MVGDDYHTMTLHNACTCQNTLHLFQVFPSLQQACCLYLSYCFSPPFLLNFSIPSHNWPSSIQHHFPPPPAFPQAALKWCNIHGAGGGAALISLRYFQPDNGHLELNGSAVTSYNAFWSQYQKALCISLQIRRQTPAVWFQHTRASSPSLAPSAFTSTWTVL